MILALSLSTILLDPRYMLILNVSQLDSVRKCVLKELQETALWSLRRTSVDPTETDEPVLKQLSYLQKVMRKGKKGYGGK